MLAKIWIENFKSFKNKTEISFEKTNYTIRAQNVADNGILKGGIFVGANASGKSNVLLSVKLLLDLLFSERPLHSGIFLCMFGTTSEYKLGYEFLIDGKRIHYEFSVDTVKKMMTEKLLLDGQVMLERMGVSARSYIADRNGINYDERDVGKETLFLRTLYFNTQFAANTTLKNWMEYLKKSIYINMFDKTILSYGRMNNLRIAKYLDAGGCAAINNFFARYHFDQKIEYEHKSEGGRILMAAGEDDQEKAIFFKRKGLNVLIPFSEESLGNQNLLTLLPSFFSAIEEDGMLLIDEFSSGFHNELEMLLVRYFMEKSHHAQLFFVSHSTNLLSNSILRPDQEYAVEFRDHMGSCVRRFSTEQPRSAQNVEKMYISGVFGGLPQYYEVDDEDQ